MPIFYYHEWILLIASAMFVGWLVSLVGNKEIQAHRLPSLLKSALSHAFFLAASSLMVMGPIHNLLRSNYYRTSIVNGILLSLAIITIFLFVRKSKNVSASNA